MKYFKKCGEKRGFTLIELIVVIAVIGILVLLAAPKFLGYTQEAKIAQIQNDVKAYENVIEIEMIKKEDFSADWESIDNQTLNGYAAGGKLYNRKGVVNSIENGTYTKVPVDKISLKSKLTGQLFMSNEGTVYYYDKAAPKVTTDKELGIENYFKFRADNRGFDTKHGKGIFEYVGPSNIDVIEIPHIIQDANVTSYKFMFENSPLNGDVKIISTNPNITDMSDMFNTVYNCDDVSQKCTTITSLDLSEFDTSNVTEMDSMFEFNGSLINLNLKGFNTAKVKNMESMFADIYSMEVLDLSDFDLSSVENVNNIFSGSEFNNVIVKDLETKNKLNSSLANPGSLNVTVKN